MLKTLAAYLEGYKKYALLSNYNMVIFLFFFNKIGIKDNNYISVVFSAELFGNNRITFIQPL